jgi:oxidoreductase
MHGGPKADPGPVRLAVLGTGWVVSQIWAPMLADHPQYEVAAVAEPDPHALRRALGLFPGARPLEAASELSPDLVDLAVVATPNHLHGPMAADLLHRGIPVFVEKPVCLTSAEAAEIADAESSGARLLAGTAAWYRADVKALRALISELGPLRSLELSWIRASGIPARGGWFTDRGRSGGGALVDLGWHLITVGFRLLGWPAVTEVAATVSADFIDSGVSDANWRQPSDDPRATLDVEDTARAAFRTESGILCTFTAAWASHADIDRTWIALEGAQGRAELLCTFGMSPHRLERPRLRLLRDGHAKDIELTTEPVGAEYRAQLKHIPALLAGPRQPSEASRETAGVVDLIERIYRSAGVMPVIPRRKESR